MTTLVELGALIEQYHSGIEAELVVLRQLEQIAMRQQAVSAARDFNALITETDTRERLTRTLVTIEDGLRELRKQLVGRRKEAEQLTEFHDALIAHREAAELVARILSTDQESLKALADAELARRASLASLDRGESTLAAYRKVLTPPVASASIVNRQG
jgi:DNA repair exonuclease SbcCD ATPase subunit